MLTGRAAECGSVDRLLEATRAGHSRTLVVRGEVGIGKSALLEYARERASGFRVLRVGGVESEMELAYAGLHQLCTPMLDRLERLPVPQRESLQTAFGLTPGTPPDRFFVGLAVLSLLADAADESPLLCLVDDAQWLDHASAQALAFVARRLDAEPVAVVVGARDSSEADEFAGVPELRLHSLADPDARSLLASAVSVRLDPGVVDRIVAETHGNPLALVELPRGMSPVELAGGFGLVDRAALSGRIEESFRRRWRAPRRERRRTSRARALDRAARAAGRPEAAASAPRCHVAERT